MSARRPVLAFVTAAAAAGAMMTALSGSAPAGAAAAEPGTFVPVGPVRILDTRSGIGVPKAAVPGHGSIAFPVAGRGGVPSSGVGAVALNVTVTGASAAGHLTVWPHGSSRPGVSNLNFAAFQTVANGATVLLPANGSLDVYNGSSGSVQVIADVSGYYAGGTVTTAGGYVPLPPARVLDTRNGTGGTVGPVLPRGSVLLQIVGAGGVPPTGASAVVLNLTATRPTAEGHLTGWDGGAQVPTASSLNFATGQTVANRAILPIGADGKVGIRNGSTTGSVQVIADVAGYFLGGVPQATGAYQPLTPVRVLDTRSYNNSTTTSVSAGGSLSLFVGEGGVPLSGVVAVAVNVTVTNTNWSGHVTVYPSGTAWPGTSSLNYAAHQTVANLLLTPVGADGRIVITNVSLSSTAVIADIVGYVRGANPAPVPVISTLVDASTCGGCLTRPFDVAADSAGNVYVADLNGGLRKVTAAGAVSQVVPGPPSGLTCASTGDGGPAADACVDAAGVTVAASGDVYVSDTVDDRVRRIDQNGVISTVAGNGTFPFCGDGGPATQACLQPVATALDAAGRLYIADPYNNNIRRVDLDGTITTVAGKVPINNFVEFCPGGPGDGGPATNACLGGPNDLTLDAQGNLYFADFHGAKVRKVDAAGIITSVAGIGFPAFCGDGGPATQACMAGPDSLAFNGNGDLLVTSQYRIRRIDAAGTITTIAGNGTLTSCGSGDIAPATCVRASGIAVDAAGRIYFSEASNRRIRLVTTPF